MCNQAVALTLGSETHNAAISSDRSNRHCTVRYQNVLRRNIAVCHRKISIDRAAQRPHFDDRWLQRARFEADPQVIHDLRDFNATELGRVDASQPLTLVIEVDQIKFNPAATDAGDGDLPTVQSQGFQCRFEDGSTHGY